MALSTNAAGSAIIVSKADVRSGTVRLPHPTLPAMLRLRGGAAESVSETPRTAAGGLVPLTCSQLEAFDTVMKRRFFFGPSFYIHGGVSGLFDYGPTGCAMKKSIIAAWREHFVVEDGMLEIDCPSVTPEPVLAASGHVQRFTDLMVRDELSGECFRADKLVEEACAAAISRLANPAMRAKELQKAGICQLQPVSPAPQWFCSLSLPPPSHGADDLSDILRAPTEKVAAAAAESTANMGSTVQAAAVAMTAACDADAYRRALEQLRDAAGAMCSTDLDGTLKLLNATSPSTGGRLSPSFPFNLMFRTSIGPSGGARGFLRPETAQGIFTNFKRLLDFNGGRLPMAVAQVGRLCVVCFVACDVQVGRMYLVICLVSCRQAVPSSMCRLSCLSCRMYPVLHCANTRHKPHGTRHDAHELHLTPLITPPYDNPTT
jgi:hypothetical protein